MAYVFLSPNVFSDNLKKIENAYPMVGVTSSTSTTSPNQAGIQFRPASNFSRPTYGFTAKRDSPAYVQIIKENGENVLVFNEIGPGRSTPTPAADKPSDPSSRYWTDFLLQSVTEERVEKTQIVETFGDSYLYAFGERPRVIRVEAVLLNTEDYNWKALFMENWERYMRATRLVNMRARLYLAFDDIIVEGYPLNTGYSLSAINTNMVSITFTMLVTNYTNTFMDKVGSINRAKAKDSLFREYGTTDGVQDPLKVDVMKANGEVVDSYNFSGDVFRGGVLAARQYLSRIQGSPFGTGVFADMANTTVGSFLLSTDAVYIRGAKSAQDVLNKYALTAAKEASTAIINAAVDALAEVTVPFAPVTAPYGQNQAGVSDLLANNPGGNAVLGAKAAQNAVVMTKLGSAGGRVALDYMFGTLRHLTFLMDSMVATGNSVVNGDSRGLFSVLNIDDQDKLTLLGDLHAFFTLGSSRRVADRMAHAFVGHANDLATALTSNSGGSAIETPQKQTLAVKEGSESSTAANNSKKSAQPAILAAQKAAFSRKIASYSGKA